MKKETKNLISLTTKEILMNLIDVNISLFDIFDRGRVYKKPIKSYQEWRNLDKEKFSKKIFSLKRQNIINIYTNEKGNYLELTQKGKEKLHKFIADDLKVTIPEKWDKKWRVIIFDIPNEKKTARDAFRSRLKQIGFLAIQESVFIFPFDCKIETDYFKNLEGINAYVLYLLVETLETDIDIFSHFLDRGILKKEMIK